MNNRIEKIDKFFDLLIELNHTTYIKDSLSGEVYVVDYVPGNYGFEIQKLTKETENAVKIDIIKEPTRKQLENALLNYVFVDNQKNKFKANTIYNLEDFNLYTKFDNFMKKVKTNQVTPSDLFEYFALDPKGEYWQGALNGLVSNVFATAQNKKPEDFDYVFRSSKSASLENLHQEKDGSYIIAKPEYGTYGYELYEVKDNKATKIKEPTAQQRKSALLNIILTDNFENPNKSGIYQFSKTMVKKIFNHSLKRHSIKNTLYLLGIDFSGELMSGMVNTLAEDIKQDKIHGQIDQAIKKLEQTF